MSSCYTHLIENKQPLEPFILEVNTALGDGLNQMRMPIQGTDMDIDWGDGTTETRTETSINLVTHSYASAGIYDITITNLEGVYFNNTGDKSKVTELKSWGISEWNHFIRSFFGCSNIDLFETPIPEWLNATSLNTAWYNCSSLTTAPDVSALTNVTSLAFTWGLCSSLTELPLIGFHIENVTRATSMATGVTATNYDAILVDFEARLENLYPGGIGYPNTGLDIHFGNSTYTLGSTAETARTNLINNFGWVITDGGGI